MTYKALLALLVVGACASRPTPYGEAKGPFGSKKPESCCSIEIDDPFFFLLNLLSLISLLMNHLIPVVGLMLPMVRFF
jgi:hypothetical protein